VTRLGPSVLPDCIDGVALRRLIAAMPVPCALIASMKPNGQACWQSILFATINGIIKGTKGGGYMRQIMRNFRVTAMQQCRARGLLVHL
jgi:hypothetical protein